MRQSWPIAEDHRLRLYQRFKGTAQALPCKRPPYTVGRLMFVYKT